MTTPTASSSSSSRNPSGNGSSTHSNGLPDDLDSPFPGVPTDPKIYDAYRQIFPHYIPMRTEKTAEYVETVMQLHLANKKLQEDAAKAKEDAAKPKPESIPLQLLKLAPDTLRVTAMAIPFFGTIAIESLKLAGMFLAAGTALGIVHQLSDSGVRIIQTVTAEAGIALKVIALVGAGAAVLKGGRVVVTEGPTTLTSVVDQIRARLLLKRQQNERPRGSFMVPQFWRQHPRFLQKVENSPQE